MLEARNLTCFRGEKRLWQNLSFSLTAGTLLLINASNGVGKTSLLRAVAGLLPIDSGELYWQGCALQPQDLSYKNASIFIGHQNNLQPALTPIENLRSLLYLSGQDVTREKLLAALNRFGLKRECNMPCENLSVGQSQRVSLSRLFLKKKVILWLIDEPFSGLDVAGQEFFVANLQQHIQQGGMAIIATHQPIALPNVTTKVMELEKYV